MSTQQKIVELFREFGKRLAIDMRKSLVKKLKESGRISPNDPKLNFGPRIKSTSTGNVVLDIVAADKYWRYIETGRKPGARRVPADKLGKKWQNQNNINAVEILSRMRKKPLKTSSKRLNYDQAAKSLAFVYQKSIFKKGIKPKPFVDRVINDGRFNDFRNQLIPLLGEQFKLVIKGLE